MDNLSGNKNRQISVFLLDPWVSPRIIPTLPETSFRWQTVVSKCRGKVLLAAVFTPFVVAMTVV